MTTDFQVETWPLDRLIPYVRNPRKNDEAVERMVASIKEFGFKIPVLVRSTGEVIDGHLRLKAARKLNITEVPVILCDEWSEAQVKAFRLLVNRSVNWAEWDEELVALEMVDLQKLEYDLALTGFDSDEVKEFLKGQAVYNEAAQDEVPEVADGPAVTLVGDLWLLGEHRVLCGDSTSTEAVDRLCAGKTPDLCFTDPPYGINIVKTGGESDKGVVVGAKPYGNSQKGVVGGGGSGANMYPFGGVKKGVVGGANIVKPKRYAPIINDESTDTALRFYHAAVQCGVSNFVIFGGNYFTDFLPPSPCWVIWDKQNSGNFADVEMAWTSFDRGAKLYAFMWNGLSRAGDRKTELATRVHPTQKPVGLIEKVFGDFPSTVCYDGFLGSGSTLIACEKTARACYGMELSPDYVDVIVKRWQDFTGKKAIHDRTGKTFEELTLERLGTTERVPIEHPEVSIAR